ncbi:MAG TPA: hypothetical protein VFE31_07040 [Opitutaceae bacterium]|jgi:molybdopterin-containing oxidoreductase family iron-sulfur binding subunit|nr:hypothetical protein [Opitutaceae bacterium]
MKRLPEFAPGADTWPEELSRRQFLELAGGTLALAGLAGCNRQPEKFIVPYVDPPPRELTGGPVFYATAMPWEGYGRGLLARANSGRPTKLEGNPSHPDSLGATDAVTQAGVLSLYDPDRSQAPRRGGEPSNWETFQDEWLARHRELDARGGEGFALLTEPTTSPALLRAIGRLLQRFPRAKWYQHTALFRYDQAGLQEDYDFARADVILGIDADFLLQHPAALRYARAFAGRRRLEKGRADSNRLYMLEATPTISGSMADHRLAVSPRRQRELLAALAAALNHQPLPGDLSAEESRVLRALAADLDASRGRALCIAGPQCDEDIRRWAQALNGRLGAGGATVHFLPAVRSDGDGRAAGGLADLRAALERHEVDLLVVAGSNPVYTAPADLEFAAAIPLARRQIHVGPYVDETAALCEWHLPESHFLEAWGDLRAFDGTVSIVQPLIAPLYQTRSALEYLDFLAYPPGQSGYDLVRATWQEKGGSAAGFEGKWEQWLQAGVMAGTANPPRPGPAARGPLPDLDAAGPESGLSVVLRPDPTVSDGRWSNCPWLQELPKPLSHLVWDNAAFVAPALAAREGWLDGDVLALDAGHGAVEASVRTLPGQAPDCIAVHLGYGRTAAGSVGNGHGFDAYRLRLRDRPWENGAVRIQRLGKQYGLVSTQRHFEMEGREIVKVEEVARVNRGDLPPPAPPHDSLYPPVAYNAHKWGMLIDLASCIGCQACVAACQAENNIPVVGRDQCAREREMHWIRVDTYYEGDAAHPRILHQPVPCQQCENAPCELVCPVAATVHSSEGLNDMVYNRCVGTRFCSNNCPYKVRRFNFLNFQFAEGSPYYLQKNPEVTVRSRGVMEKCTYCVQRIDDGRIAAERENRPLRDGEIRTACQQVCPAEAIVFGDLNDPAARVRARKAEPTHYGLLDDLNTRPRTTYLARLLNPAPEA